jgi:hypothetical protein
VVSALLPLLVTSAAVADAQDAPGWSRAARLVLYSPHFDLVPEPYGGLSCPPQPLRLYGFETPSRDTATVLHVRLLLASTPPLLPPAVTFSGETVRLSRRWQENRLVDLPDTPPWRATTDAEGHALLRAPAGIYELHITAGGALGRGIIQLRPGRRDSLHAYVRPQALC